MPAASARDLTVQGVIHSVVNGTQGGTPFEDRKSHEAILCCEFRSRRDMRPECLDKQNLGA